MSCLDARRLAPALVLIALLLAGCGGSSSNAGNSDRIGSGAGPATVPTVTAPSSAPARRVATVVAAGKAAPLAALPPLLGSSAGTASAAPAGGPLLTPATPVAVDLSGAHGIGVSSAVWDGAHQLDPTDISAERSRSYDRQPDGSDRYTNRQVENGRVVGYTIHLGSQGIAADAAQQQMQAELPPDASKTAEAVVAGCGAVLRYRSASLAAALPGQQGVITVSLGSTNSATGAYDPARVSLARLMLGNLDDGAAC